jgi:hypothetical protein
MALVELLGLVPAEDAHDVGAARDEVIDEARTDGPRTAGDQDATAADVRAVVDGAASCAGRPLPVAASARRGLTRR